MKEVILPYLHPVFQILVLLIGLKTTLSGLRMRSERRYPKKRGVRLQLRNSHIGWGILFILLFTTGYAAGILSMILIRGKNPLRTPHAYFSTFCLSLFLIGGILGIRLRRIENPPEDDLQLHALFTLSGFILSLLNVIFGYGLLP